MCLQRYYSYKVVNQRRKTYALKTQMTVENKGYEDIRKTYPKKKRRVGKHKNKGRDIG